MNQEWITSFWNRIENKLSVIAPLVETPYPYTTDDGGKLVSFRDETWWTNGFWAGMMWLAFKETKKTLYKDIAIASEKALDQAFLSFDGLHHDVGFMWLPSAVAHYCIDGNAESKTRGMHAATLLAGRFNCMGEFIRAWNRDQLGWVIIDSMMNIPLLHWAHKETEDPRFYHIAVKHADTVMKNFVREDGSVHHIVELNPLTGQVVSIPIGQGYASGSSWSRGQAWAIYGFAVAYNYTQKTEYLDTAMKLLDKFMAESKGKVPAWDFRLPEFEEKALDTSAAAIVLCGIIELEKHKTTLRLQKYKQMLRDSLEEYIDYDEDVMGILREQNGRHHYTSYGDYFWIESFMKENAEIQVW